jgi:surface polysaccharide O-acyltransferase-like enzyme
VPLIFFAIVNIIYAASEYNFSKNNLVDFVFSQIKRITDYPSSPLWFLVVLAFLYYLNPIWQLIFKNKNKKVSLNLIIFSLVFSISLTILKFPAGKVGTMLNSFTSWTAFVFFYLYGAAVEKKWINFKNNKFNFSLILFGLALNILGDYLTTWHQINGDNFIWAHYASRYLSIPVIAMSIGIFNFLISLDLSKINSKLIVFLSKLSFGIYLIHTYVISIFTDKLGFTFDRLKINVYLYNFLNVFLVFSISFILTLFIKRIPKLRIIIGEK